MTYRIFPLPKFDELTNKGILEAYNDLNDGVEGFKIRKAPFASKEEGVARCQAAWKAWAKANPETAEAKVARLEAVKAAREAAKAAKPAKTPKAAKATNGAGPSKLDGTIKILTEKGENPYKEGKISYKMFEVMKKHPTVSDYYDHAAKYSNVAEENRRKDCGQWLSNAKRDGYVEVI